MGLTLNSSNMNLAGSLNSGTNERPAKAGPSKFDEIRGKLDASDPKVVAQGGVGQSTASSQALQKALAVNDPNLSRLRQQVNASPQLSSAPKITEALAGLEKQYTKLNSVFKNMPSNATPQQLLALQQRVYDIGESVGVLSKLVDQATSTTKTIFQTQI